MSFIKTESGIYLNANDINVISPYEEIYLANAMESFLGMFSAMTLGDHQGRTPLIYYRHEEDKKEIEGVFDNYFLNLSFGHPQFLDLKFYAESLRKP